MSEITAGNRIVDGAFTAVLKETVVLKCTAERECASYTTQGSLFLFFRAGISLRFSLRNIIGAEAWLCTAEESHQDRSAERPANQIMSRYSHRII